MYHNIHFRHSKKIDLPQIEAILQANNLITSDLSNPKINFIVANCYNELIACVGLEVYGKDSLLRSFAVVEQFRNQKIGLKLIDFAIAFAHQKGVSTIHLLTNTAKIYFEKHGFIEKERLFASEQIRSTKEFSSLCPSSSHYMVLEELHKKAHYYSASINDLKTDEESKAKFWAIRGNKISFSYFEVPAKTVFEKHSHKFEQITYVLEGVLYFEIDGKQFCLKKSDIIVIPANITHKVWTDDEKVIAVDAWSTSNIKQL
jgi:amino-acid N-acetyltransferase